MAQVAPPRVTVGVDTHKHVHVAAARDQLGRRLGTTVAPASSTGYGQLLGWARGLGEVAAWGVEGTSSYGAGLARFLAGHGERVVEVNRPDRQLRRRRGKSDAVDADAAARTVQAGEATGVPKAQDGVVEMVRALRVARQTAVKAPHPGGQRRQGAAGHRPSGAARAAGRPAHGRAGRSGHRARARPGGHPIGGLRAGSAQPGRALPAPGRRGPGAERRAGAAHRQPRAGAARPARRRPRGRRRAAGLRRDNPARLASEAAFAALCGTSPVEASSGETHRHRLNRGGDRQANAALHRIVVVRLRWHQPTRDYLARRTAQGKTKKEILRCLKRYVAREVFAVLHQLAEQDQATAA